MRIVWEQLEAVRPELRQAIEAQLNSIKTSGEDTLTSVQIALRAAPPGTNGERHEVRVTAAIGRRKIVVARREDSDERAVMLSVAALEATLRKLMSAPVAPAIVAALPAPDPERAARTPSRAVQTQVLSAPRTERPRLRLGSMFEHVRMPGSALASALKRSLSDARSALRRDITADLEAAYEQMARVEIETREVAQRTEVLDRSPVFEVPAQRLPVVRQPQVLTPQPVLDSYPALDVLQPPLETLTVVQRTVVETTRTVVETVETRTRVEARPAFETTATPVLEASRSASRPVLDLRSVRRERTPPTRFVVPSLRRRWVARVASVACAAAVGMAGFSLWDAFRMGAPVFTALAAPQGFSATSAPLTGFSAVSGLAPGFGAVAGNRAPLKPASGQRP